MMFCINCNAEVKDDEFYKTDDLDDSALETLCNHDCEPIEGSIICKECMEFVTKSCSNDLQNEETDEDVESTEVLEVPSSPELTENEKETSKLIEVQNKDGPSQGMKRKLLNEELISVKTAKKEWTPPEGPSESTEQNSNKVMEVLETEGPVMNCWAQEDKLITNSVRVKPSSHIVAIRSSAHDKEASENVNESENNILLQDAPRQSEAGGSSVLREQTLMCKPVSLGKVTEQSPSKCVQDYVDKMESTDPKTDELTQKGDVLSPNYKPKKNKRRGSRGGKKKKHTGLPRNGGTRIITDLGVYRMPKYKRPSAKLVLEKSALTQESEVLLKDASDNSESASDSTTDTPCLNNAQPKLTQISSNYQNEQSNNLEISSVSEIQSKLVTAEPQTNQRLDKETEQSPSKCVSVDKMESTDTETDKLSQKGEVSSSENINDSENNILLEDASSQSEAGGFSTLKEQKLMCVPVGLEKETEQSPSKCVQDSEEKIETTDPKTDELTQNGDILSPNYKPKKNKRRGSRGGKKKKHTGLPRNGGTRIITDLGVYRMPKYKRPSAKLVLEKSALTQESEVPLKDASDNSESASDSTTDTPLNADSMSVTTHCAKMNCHSMDHRNNSINNKSVETESPDLDAELRSEEADISINVVKPAVQEPIWSVTPVMCMLDQTVVATNQDMNNSVYSKAMESPIQQHCISKNQYNAPKSVADVLENQSVISHLIPCIISSRSSENTLSLPSDDLPKSGLCILENRSVFPHSSPHKTDQIKISDSNPLLPVPSPPPPPVWPSKRELDKIKAKLPEKSRGESLRSGLSGSNTHHESAFTSRFHEHSEGRSSHYNRKSDPKWSVNGHSDERMKSDSRIHQHLNRRSSSHDKESDSKSFHYEQLDETSWSYDRSFSLARSHQYMDKSSAPDANKAVYKQNDLYNEMQIVKVRKRNKKKRTGLKRNGGRKLPDGTRLPSYKRPLPGEKPKLPITKSLQINKETPEILPNDTDGNKTKPNESVDISKEIESSVILITPATTNHDGQLLQQSDSLSNDNCGKTKQDSSADKSKINKPACTKTEERLLKQTDDCINKVPKLRFYDSDGNTNSNETELAAIIQQNVTESVSSSQQKDKDGNTFQRKEDSFSSIMQNLNENPELFQKIEDENVNPVVQENIESVTSAYQNGNVCSFQQNDCNHTSSQENTEILNSRSQRDKNVGSREQCKNIDSCTEIESNSSILSDESLSTREKNVIIIQKKTDPSDQKTVCLEECKASSNQSEEMIDQTADASREQSNCTRETKDSTSQLEESLSSTQKEVKNIDQKEEVSGRQMDCTTEAKQKKKRRRGLPRNGGNRLPDGTRLPKYRRPLPGGVVKPKSLSIKSKEESELALNHTYYESKLHLSVDSSNETSTITTSESTTQGQPESQTEHSIKKEDIKDNVSILETYVGSFKESMSDDKSINSLLQQSVDPSKMDVSLEVLSSDDEINEMEGINTNTSEKISNVENTQSNASATTNKIEPFADNFEEISYTENLYSNTSISIHKIAPFSDQIFNTEISDTSNIPKMPSVSGKCEKISNTENLHSSASQLKRRREGLVPASWLWSKLEKNNDSSGSSDAFGTNRKPLAASTSAHQSKSSPNDMIECKDSGISMLTDDTKDQSDVQKLTDKEWENNLLETLAFSDDSCEGNVQSSDNSNGQIDVSKQQSHPEVRRRRNKRRRTGVPRNGGNRYFCVETQREVRMPKYKRTRPNNLEITPQDREMASNPLIHGDPRCSNNISNVPRLPYEDPRSLPGELRMYRDDFLGDPTNCGIRNYPLVFCDGNLDGPRMNFDRFSNDPRGFRGDPRMHFSMSDDPRIYSDRFPNNPRTYCDNILFEPRGHLFPNNPRTYCDNILFEPRGHLF